MGDETGFDALLPSAMAAKAVDVGVKKAKADAPGIFVLAVLAGAFIAVGALFSTTVWAGSSGLPYGFGRLLGGLVFSTGLILVVVGGAELFTGNSLLIMAFASGNLPFRSLLRHWLIVYVGNFAGSIATAYIVFLSRQYTFGNGAVGVTALTIANTKSGFGFFQAMALGILCNALVCLAIWLCFSAHSTTDRIISVVPPITAFVAAGFEHSIANMYFIPVALFISTDTGWIQSLGDKAPALANLSWTNLFIRNLLPVTIGNIIGGAGLVGLVYWFVYLRKPVSLGRLRRQTMPADLRHGLQPRPEEMQARARSKPVSKP